MSFEYEIDDVDYNDQNGTLFIEVEPILENSSFSAYNEFGTLHEYDEGPVLSGVNIIGATLYLVGNNGEEVGEINFDDNALDEFSWLETYLIEKMGNEDL